MAEVLFYHLTASPLERSLPELLGRSLDRGWRVVVRAGSEPRLSWIDEMLWTHDEQSFLPHGTAAMGHAELQPIYLTTGPENPAGATVLMLAGGARVDPAESKTWDRVCLLFDGGDEAELSAARQDWLAVRDAGLTGKYWAQEGGRWIEKASTGS